MVWNRVEDKLPEIGKKCEPYLVLENRQRVVRVWNGYYHNWDDEDGDDYITDAVGGNITHWMKLPEPPVV